jgi:hypothetical protein
MLNSIPEGISPPSGMEAPTDYLEFLSVADGGIFGRIGVFAAKLADKMQFYADEFDGAPVRLGHDAWFCFGRVNENPLFIDRRNGSVWGFPEVGILWWQGQAFERFASDLGGFLVEYVFGRGYLAISGASEDDQWSRLLERMRHPE